MLLYLIDFNVLFDGHSSTILNTHYGLDTALVSAIEEAKSDDKVIEVLTEDLGIAKDVIKPADVEIVKWACRMVSSRAASLSACALAAVILHTGRPSPRVRMTQLTLGWTEGETVLLYLDRKMI